MIALRANFSVCSKQNEYMFSTVSSRSLKRKLSTFLLSCINIHKYNEQNATRKTEVSALYRVQQRDHFVHFACVDGNKERETGVSGTLNRWLVQRCFGRIV